MNLQERDTRESVARVETLIEELEGLGDPRARDKAAEIVGALLELYGEGMNRMMETVSRDDNAGKLFESFAEDELVSHLLLLHGLHPLDVEARVEQALEGVRPYLNSHGGDVELLGVQAGVAHLRLQGSCDGCPSSTMTLKLAIEEAIEKAAPDLEGIEAEGATEPPQQSATIVAGPTIGRKKKQKDPVETSRRDVSDLQDVSASWEVVGGLPQLAGGGTLRKEVRGEPVLFLKIEADVYSYRDECPGCEGSLEKAGLKGAELSCPNCGRRYDARRAGRCLDDPRLYLGPVPLLTSDQGIVKVALEGVAAG